MENFKTVWDFVEAYYPNYSSCDKIARNNDLQLIIDEALCENDVAHFRDLLIENNAFIFRKSIEGYIKRKNDFVFYRILENAKAEILEDIKTKLIPRTVVSFSELHDFVDANCYGGFCEENYEASKDYEFENSIQSAVDEWLKNGRI